MNNKDLPEHFEQPYNLLPSGISNDIGHFNVFDIGVMVAKHQGKPYVPYNNRVFYKIALKKGHNIVQFSDESFEIKGDTLLFATPKYPSNWLPQNAEQKGHICIFTDEFLIRNKSGFLLDELPVFKSGSRPVFALSAKESKKINNLFIQIHEEIGSDYAFKYDLIRNLVLEIIHFAQKKMTSTSLYATKDASSRIVGLFIELLERQFPIESPIQRLSLLSAIDYARKLSVHINHLNMVVKEKTGKTTTEFINNRIANEAKILLRNSNWQISEIAYSLGFEELAHFSNFFKKNTSFTPTSFRESNVL
ncbi:helix-turn-helix domain-containing protein [uncultured Sphingobacterium sp.]|uniref:helix-turn-helix domain-containing protein n=1 Tax=uncultured Sphingobacterium sp. TaxID=182688 RepID=UPI0037479F93